MLTGSHRNDMASLFDPPMRELTALVDTQANLAKQKGKRIDVSQSQTSHATETYLFCLAAIHPCGRLWRFGIPEQNNERMVYKERGEKVHMS
jgi:hypothetical protein